MLEAAKHTSATPQNTEEEEAQKLQTNFLELSGGVIIAGVSIALTLAIDDDFYKLFTIK